MLWHSLLLICCSSGSFSFVFGEVEHGCRFCRVLNLASNALSGTLSTELTLLRLLTVLDLSGNSLIGSLPSTFVQHTALLHLDVSHNNFSGGPPHAVSMLTTLVYVASPQCP